VALLVAAAPAQAAPSVTPSCSLTPSTAVDCSIWFRSAATLHWNVAPETATTTGCDDQVFDADTAATAVSCTATEGEESVTGHVTIKRDATPPEVGAAVPARGADAAGWYNQPVTMTFTGQDATSGVSGCPPVIYDGPDSAAASAVGTCADVAGNVGTSPPFGFKYDATGPDVLAAVPERPPDHAGWFTAPVMFTFVGADATSGLAGCTPVTYAGPDGAGATVLGTCWDFAGNVSSRAFGLMYDATAPPVTGLRAVAGDRRVALRWSTAPDVTFIEVLRIPGLGTQAASVVFRGPGSSFEDDAVANGVSYVFRVRLRDAAGNESSDSVTVTPTLPSADPLPGTGGPSGPTPKTRPRSAHLRLPRANAVVRLGRPPLLRWTKVTHARFYNVQLYRGTRKILSAWPARPRYQLTRRWDYAGKRHRLTRGRYVWYVWPGFGRRSAARYGDLLGRRAFRVVR
jgi:hypothetical protein